MSLVATAVMAESENDNHNAMTIRELLIELANRPLGTSDIEESIDRDTLQREAREIVASCMCITPGEVSRRQDEPADPRIVPWAKIAAERRTIGLPLAYAVNSAAFRHLDLFVNQRVLIPRPETEIVVDHALRVSASSPGGTAVDIGTGSGAIAISLATEGRFDHIIATDISHPALELACYNFNSIDTRAVNTGRARPTHIEFRQGSDFEPLRGIKANLVVSNPPYIAHEEAASLPSSVRNWEPATALFADDGGMARYNALLAGAPDHLVPGGWLVLELDSRRGQETARRARQTGFFSTVEVHPDLTGRDRVLLAQLKSDISPD